MPDRQGGFHNDIIFEFSNIVVQNEYTDLLGSLAGQADAENQKRCQVKAYNYDFFHRDPLIAGISFQVSNSTYAISPGFGPCNIKAFNMHQ
jgi:hypothetical protein